MPGRVEPNTTSTFDGTSMGPKQHMGVCLYMKGVGGQFEKFGGGVCRLLCMGDCAGPVGILGGRGTVGSAGRRSAWGALCAFQQCWKTPYKVAIGNAAPHNLIVGSAVAADTTTEEY